MTTHSQTSYMYHKWGQESFRGKKQTNQKKTTKNFGLKLLLKCRFKLLFLINYFFYTCLDHKVTEKMVNDTHRQRRYRYKWRITTDDYDQHVIDVHLYYTCTVTYSWFLFYKYCWHEQKKKKYRNILLLPFFNEWNIFFLSIFKLWSTCKTVTDSDPKVWICLT